MSEHRNYRRAAKAVERALTRSGLALRARDGSPPPPLRASDPVRALRFASRATVALRGMLRTRSGTTPDQKHVEGGSGEQVITTAKVSASSLDRRLHAAVAASGRQQSGPASQGEPALPMQQAAMDSLRRGVEGQRQGRSGQRPLLAEQPLTRPAPRQSAAIALAAQTLHSGSARSKHDEQSSSHPSLDLELPMMSTTLQSIRTGAPLTEQTSSANERAAEQRERA
jgi:hypothetical protein